MIGRYDGWIARTFKAGWLMLKWVCLLVMLGFATGAAFLVGIIWVDPERDFIDAQLEGASCGKYTGRIQKGGEEICEAQRLRESGTK